VEAGAVSESDRLRRLRKLREALDAPLVPRGMSRASVAHYPTVPPRYTYPGPVVPGTRAELAAAPKGSRPLRWLAAALSPLAALERWHLQAATVALAILGALNAYWFQWGLEKAAITIIATAALPALLSGLCDLLFRLTVIPGIRLHVALLQWARERHRALVIVRAWADTPLRGRWKRAVQVQFASGAIPARTLDVVTDLYDDNSKLDIALLVEAPALPLDDLLVWVRVPDGRLAGMEASIRRFREERCARCLGEETDCALCGGTYRVPEAQFL
jgi:hypothetical protein